MTARRPIQVRLLYFDDCPTWRLADARLREALDQVGADPDMVVYQTVNTIEEAEALGASFGGSPTILVDGRDPFGRDGAGGGLACRTYRSDAGDDHAPTVAALVSALSH